MDLDGMQAHVETLVMNNYVMISKSHLEPLRRVEDIPSRIWVLKGWLLGAQCPL